MQVRLNLHPQKNNTFLDDFIRYDSDGNGDGAQEMPGTTDISPTGYVQLNKLCLNVSIVDASFSPKTAVGMTAC